MRCTINHYYRVIARAILLVFMLCITAHAAQPSLAQPAGKPANVAVNFDMPRADATKQQDSTSATTTEKVEKVEPSKKSKTQSAAENDEDTDNIYLNFENSSLGSVLNYLAEQKKINVLPQSDLDEQKVSLTTREPLSLDRAWNVLLTLLEINGFSIIKVGDLYRVISNKDNGHEPLPSFAGQ